MNTPWQPKNDFEKEIVNSQPYNDFIFGGLTIMYDDEQVRYPRPQKHLDYIEKVKLQFQQEKKTRELYGLKVANKLKLLSEIQRMAGIKSIGDEVTIDEWDNYDNIEKETLGMMRYFGMQPSIDEPLNENLTLPSYPLTNKNPLIRNGQCLKTMILDHEMFEMKPLIPTEENSVLGNEDNSILPILGNAKVGVSSEELEHSKTSTATSRSITNDLCNKQWPDLNSSLNKNLKVNKNKKFMRNVNYYGGRNLNGIQKIKSNNMNINVNELD